MGPIINEPAMETYEEAAEEARKNGTIVTGGQRITEGDFGRGLFVEPTIVEVPEDSWIWKKELFVPFVAVAPFDELDEAIEKANDTEYGLTAGFFSEDQAEIDEWLDRIQAGVVYVNRRAGSTTGAWPGVQPFGGWKGSGTTGKAGGGPYYVAAVPARAVADGDRGVSLERRSELEGLAAHSGPSSSPRCPGPRRWRGIERDAQGHLALAAARLPVRAQARRGLDRRGRRRQPLPRPQRRHRGDVHGPLPSRGGRGDPAAGRRSCCTTRRATSTCRSTPRSAERLDRDRAVRRAPARVFLTNSGTEAVEAAIKLARYATGRQYLIGFYQSFHGRSMGSVTLTASKAKYRQNFGPMLPSVYHSFYGDFDYLEQVLFKRVVSPNEVAAIVVESWSRRGWLRAAARGLVPLPARALRPPRHPARLRRGAVGHGPQRHDVGDRAGGRRRPTSSPRARASRAGCRSAR